MNQVSTNNRRIAKNTIFLYIRMVITMFITLFTSRIVLNQLGETNYGVYNVVAGIVTIFSFLSGAMASSASRFIAYAIGQRNEKKIESIFSTIMFSQLLLCLIILILSETVGLWYVQNILKVPQDLFVTVEIIYQISIFNILIGVITIPFTSLIIANEKMDIYAYLAIIEVIFKLGIAFTLMVIQRKLLYYALMLLIVQICIMLAYITYSKRKRLYKKISFVPDKGELRNILNFSGWTLYANGASICGSQGINLILNYFFGVIVNTAYGLTLQIQSAIRSFSLGFQTALNPQIIKTYAANEIDNHNVLIIRSIKYSFFLFAFFAIPVFFNIHFILDIWLSKYPIETISFVKWSIVTVIINIISNPLAVSVSASGNIGKMTFCTSTLGVATIPVSFFLLKLIHDVYIPLVVFFVSSVLSFFIDLYFCHKLTQIDYIKLLKISLLPIIYVGITSSLLSIIIQHFDIHSLIKISLDFLVTLITIFYLGLIPSERVIVINFLKKQINQIIRKCK